MTRSRTFGADVPFCEWLRKCKELPSYSKEMGFVATDTDLVVHRYLQAVDGIGTRDVQALMHVEIKTRGGHPSTSQMDTLCKLNLFKGHKNNGKIVIRWFGVFVLVMSAETPDDSDWMQWFVFPKGRLITDIKQCVRHSISRADLIRLLRFDIHPINFTENAFRRHHATTEIVAVRRAPLGFEYEEKIIKRS